MTSYLTYETHVDVNQDCRYWEGDGDTYDAASRGELFRQLRATFGRCVSKMYREPGVAVGWVFRQRTVNDDNPYCVYRYTREVWVEVRETAAAG